MPIRFAAAGPPAGTPLAPPGSEALPASARARVLAGVLLAWLGFWALMVAVAVQDALRHDPSDLLRPVVAELSSMAVASVVFALLWRWSRRLDPLLARPSRWFLRVLAWLPAVAPGFVLAVYALRHAVADALGRTWPGEPGGALLAYESLKFAVFYVLFSGVQFGLRSYLAWHAERWRAAQAQRLSQQAQLLQLTQQLQPHFLFNALNTIASLIHDAPERADALLTKLALLLRAACDAGQRATQPLADEMALLRAYGELMSERFGDRVHIEWRVEPAVLGCEVPTLGLQPLLENCFRHVVEPRLAPTHIVVEARAEPGALVFEVRDDGGSLPAHPVRGVGLGNLEQRLQALHGAQARVELHGRDGGGVIARVVLPCAC